MKKLPSFGWLAALAALSLAGYLAVSELTFRVGFPLDDAWIHQTYARNLALHGEWAYWPGEPSAGSTAPLWSLLLAGGFGLRLGPYVWAYLAGWLCLAGLAWMGRAAFAVLNPQRSGWAFWAGIFLVFEYHLVWAAGSGMETALFALVVMVVLNELLQENPGWARIGWWVGIAVWTRPDGITLLGPAMMVLLMMNEIGWRKRLAACGKLSVGVVVLVGLYLVFNLSLAGDWLPNTFFAKQAEYAIYREFPLIRRVAAQMMLPLIGAGALLLPGLLFIFNQAVRQRRWAVLAGILWLGGYLLMYALRLPVTYQHGRYIIPAMPVYFIWALAGLSVWVQPQAPRAWKRALSQGWIIALGAALLVFWGIGAKAYGQDVAVIESEMVDTARWVSQNTDPQALVAAHDIGALGYFGERHLLDLAGLVSPEVIPFIRDEARLKSFLDERQAEYLVTFPNWYPELVTHGRALFSTQATFSPSLGGENMTVYRWSVP